MVKKFFNFIKRHKFVALIIIIVLILGGYYGSKSFNNEEEPIRYLLAKAVRGTISSTVSGNGQVTTSDQIDIKSKVSGDVVYVGAKKGQEVKANELLAQIDTREIQKTLRDAETSLETAELELEELLSPVDELTLLQSENSVINARRNLEKAEDDFKKVNLDAEQTLSGAYEDGYNAVSNAFLGLPDQIKNLKEVMGSKDYPDENITSYKLILGEESPFIKRFVDDYYQANDLFNKNFSFFRTVTRSASRAELYQLFDDTLITTKVISQALESARNMFDAIINSEINYKRYYIGSSIDSLKAAISNGIASVNSMISSLQKIKDTIDETNQNTPINLKNAQVAIDSAKESLREKEIALAKIKAGPDDLDVRAKKIAVQQKKDALTTVKENLADHYIRVPFDGVVADIKVKKGETISAGVVATLITKQQIAEITLNEIDVAKIQLGQKATISFDAVEDLTITGRVIEIDTIGTVSQGVVTYNVKIAFDTQDERIKPGMSVSADIITDVGQDVLLVPNSAIKQEGNIQYVEILKEGGVVRQTVKTGISNDLSTEIIDGLEEGVEVITGQISTLSSTQSSKNSSEKNSNNLPRPEMQLMRMMH